MDRVESRSGIVWTDGVISLVNAKAEPIQIKELAMVDFERYYRLWHTAIASTMKPGNHQTFVQAWSTNPAFRKAAYEALQIAGIERPELLTPLQLEELFLQAIVKDNGVDTLSQGLIFRLHYQVPGKPQEQVEPEPKKSMSQSLISSLWHGIQQRLSLVSQALSMSGL